MNIDASFVFERLDAVIENDLILVSEWASHGDYSTLVHASISIGKFLSLWQGGYSFSRFFFHNRFFSGGGLAGAKQHGRDQQQG